ncbi:hypothetical protein EDB80DRAFT_756284 [Ilyonectria destructans]|nr:hypothetical protein EDB80DRAFT_756284 [Ilyonectria destructans]
MSLRILIEREPSFQPLAIGSTKLGHRLAMAPLTRFRCDYDWIPTEMTKEYYKQRACVPGTLIITEATSHAQIAAWKGIVDMHQGRAGGPDVLAEGGFRLLSSSATPVAPSQPQPITMSEEGIQQTIADFATAAKNAVAAGFDGVELLSRIGADKTAMRLSPSSDFLGMLMDEPEPTFRYLTEQLKPLVVAYPHLIEARIRGNDDAECGGQRTVKWMVELWDNVSPVLIAGGFKADSARTAVDEVYKNYDVAIVFGRYFVANPDLVFRIKSGVGLEKYERTYFYTPKLWQGYVDYPFS